MQTKGAACARLRDGGNGLFDMGECNARSLCEAGTSAKPALKALAVCEDVGLWVLRASSGLGWEQRLGGLGSSLNFTRHFAPFPACIICEKEAPEATKDPGKGHG